MLDNLNTKKILILGFGKEGISTYNYLRSKYPNFPLAIADEKRVGSLSAQAQTILSSDINLKTYLGGDYLSGINNFDLIIKTPGLPSSKLQSNNKITSQTAIFLESFRERVVGITGTKGKSTTASLIYQILKDASLKVELIGNIGTPPLDKANHGTKETLYVYELSSYQLENLKVSPHIAVFLNIFKEHLDYHGNFKKYLESKLNITKWQTEQDYLIYNADSGPACEVASKSKAQKISFTAKSAIVDGTQLRGTHNQYNIQAAVKVAKLFNIPQDSILKSLKNFKPLEHRLEYVGNVNGIDFYNDSIATVPEAAVAAIDALKPKVSTIILGGLDRGLDFKQLANKIIQEKIANLILFSTTGQIIKHEIQKLNPSNMPQTHNVTNMQKAVEIAAKVTKSGSICLLSPASPSFNLFKNYEDRGEQFKQEVLKLK